MHSGDALASVFVLLEMRLTFFLLSNVRLPCFSQSVNGVNIFLLFQCTVALLLIIWLFSCFSFSKYCCSLHFHPENMVALLFFISQCTVALLLTIWLLSCFSFSKYCCSLVFHSEHMVALLFYISQILSLLCFSFPQYCYQFDFPFYIILFSFVFRLQNVCFVVVFLCF